MEVPLGRRLLILGPDGIGKSAARPGDGRDLGHRARGGSSGPSPENILFVPQRPYTALGTLRDQFFDADYLGADADERLVAALCQLAFGPILDRVGGLDVERDWANLLTVGEQQLLGIARLLIAQPRFAFLDRATNALSPSRVRHVYEVLSAYLDHLHQRRRPAEPPRLPRQRPGTPGRRPVDQRAGPGAGRRLSPRRPGRGPDGDARPGRSCHGGHRPSGIPKLRLTSS